MMLAHLLDVTSKWQQVKCLPIYKKEKDWYEQPTIWMPHKLKPMAAILV